MSDIPIIDLHNPPAGWPGYRSPAVKLRDGTLIFITSPLIALAVLVLIGAAVYVAWRKPEAFNM